MSEDAETNDAEDACIKETPPGRRIGPYPWRAMRMHDPPFNHEHGENEEEQEGKIGAGNSTHLHRIGGEMRERKEMSEDIESGRNILGAKDDPGNSNQGKSEQALKGGQQEGCPVQQHKLAHSGANPG